LERQIEEFYGPLFNLVNHLFLANQIHEELKLSIQEEAAKKRVSDFFQETQYIPLHENISTILKNKLYLAEGVDIPESFLDYMKHSTQQRIQGSLWSRIQIDTSKVSGEPWPDQFYPDIENALKKSMRDHEETVEQLRWHLGVGQNTRK
jgi:hypothetical protein